MEATLFKRQVIDELYKYLFTNDIIVIHGARQVGKTSILMFLRQHLQQNNEITHYIDLEDSRYVTILNDGVERFLIYLREEGFHIEQHKDSGRKIFIMIDEIQYLTDPSPFLKLVTDHYPAIKLIVSGSSSFAIKSKFTDSLVGRTVNFEIYPLSFQEFLIFKGIKYLPGIPLTDKKINEIRQLYEEFALYGGYPKIVLTSDISMKEKYLQQIADTYIRKDIRDLAQIKDIQKFNRLVELMASQSGNLLNITEVSNTCTLSKQTVEHYLFLLEQTYIIRLVRPFSRNPRTELFRTPKVFFIDTGLMQILWLKRLQQQILGSVFETSIFSELIKNHNPDQVKFWRTTDKKEIDFILNLPEGVLPIEVKLNFPHTLPSVLRNFWKTGKSTDIDYRLVSLYGSPNTKGMIFPWQL
jgi:predicted AAA+ superfamily ATPase